MLIQTIIRNYNKKMPTCKETNSSIHYQKATDLHCCTPSRNKYEVESTSFSLAQTSQSLPDGGRYATSYIYWQWQCSWKRKPPQSFSEGNRFAPLHISRNEYKVGNRKPTINHMWQHTPLLICWQRKFRWKHKLQNRFQRVTDMHHCTLTGDGVEKTSVHNHSQKVTYMHHCLVPIFWQWECSWKRKHP